MSIEPKSRTVTKQDVLAALGAMRSLPTRGSDDLDALFGAYVTAMQGTQAVHLQQAVTAIMRGALGHGFLPSPPELRIECDKIAKAEQAQRARLIEQRRRLDEMAGYERSLPEPTPEAKARVQAMVDAFMGRSSGA